MISLKRITQALAVPWVALGDMNMPPESLKATGWLEKLGAELLVPADAELTCTNGRRKGRLIDYGFCSPEARQLVQQLRVVHEVPWGTTLGALFRITSKAKGHADCCPSCS